MFDSQQKQLDRQDLPQPLAQKHGINHSLSRLFFHHLSLDLIVAHFFLCPGANASPSPAVAMDTTTKTPSPLGLSSLKR